MTAGFVHGVLNTDNMNVTGESFDYGPYRFLPVYDPSVHGGVLRPLGLYAYERQPASVLWNLAALRRHPGRAVAARLAGACARRLPAGAAARVGAGDAAPSGIDQRSATSATPTCCRSAGPS